MTRRLRTVLIGLGKIGALYADDPITARHFPYASHAQVLRDHPAFQWDAVVDTNDDALRIAVDRWRVPHACHTTGELAERCSPDVAIVATPPSARRLVLDALPSLRAVLVEKPLGASLQEARAFVTDCHARGLMVCVNLWRRADATLRRWAEGELHEHVGRLQAVSGIYGNGILNNGTHLVDLARMLCGPLTSPRAVAGARPYANGPLPGDVNLPFTLSGRDGLTLSIQPVDFAHYRENALDIWGERGRASIYQEGLAMTIYPLGPHRAMSGACEIVTDGGVAVPCTAGTALYDLYSNLADALHQGAPLWSDARSALESETLVHGVLQSAHLDPDTGRP